MNTTEEEVMYENMPDDILHVKDLILEGLDGERTPVIVMALMSALIEVIVRTAPSKESAIEMSGGIALSLTASINACDESGMANWSSPQQ